MQCSAGFAEWCLDWSLQLPKTNAGFATILLTWTIWWNKAIFQPRLKSHWASEKSGLWTSIKLRITNDPLWSRTVQTATTTWLTTPLAKPDRPTKVKLYITSARSAITPSLKTHELLLSLLINFLTPHNYSQTITLNSYSWLYSTVYFSIFLRGLQNFLSVINACRMMKSKFSMKSTSTKISPICLYIIRYFCSRVSRADPVIVTFGDLSWQRDPTHPGKHWQKL